MGIVGSAGIAVEVRGGADSNFAIAGEPDLPGPELTRAMRWNDDAIALSILRATS
jgi:hypothetical protein